MVALTKEAQLSEGGWDFSKRLLELNSNAELCFVFPKNMLFLESKGSEGGERLLSMKLHYWKWFGAFVLEAGAS